jgi:hypothetical protein
LPGDTEPKRRTYLIPRHVAECKTRQSTIKDSWTALLADRRNCKAVFAIREQLQLEP